MQNDLCKKIDLYKVLGVDSDSTTREIKNSYKKLALKYHPDKNRSDNSNEKFIQIKYAYDILSNEQLRKEYDFNIQNKNTDYKPSDFDYKIFNFLNTNIFLSYLKSITSNKNYLDLIEIIYKKIKNQTLNLESIGSFEILNSVAKLLDIDYVVEFNLEEVYNHKYKLISIDRVTKNKFEEKIYPVDFCQIYENEGEKILVSDVKLEGNIKISIKITTDTYFEYKYYIVKNDLYCNIPKNKIVNNTVSIDFLDGNRYNIDMKSSGWENMDIGKIYKIENKGMCYYDGKELDEYIDFENGLEIRRGNVYFIMLL